MSSTASTTVVEESGDSFAFPLTGVRASHLKELCAEVADGYVKFGVRLVGKALAELPSKAVARLVENAPSCLGVAPGKPKSGTSRARVVDALPGAPSSRASSIPEEATLVVVVLQVDDEKSMSAVRETLRTAVLRQKASQRLGEEAEIVPFLGFSQLELVGELELTTQDVVEVFIRPRCAATEAYVDTEAAKKHVGPAGTFLIHAWSAPFSSIWLSVEAELARRGEDPDKTHLWLDALSMPQNVRLQVTPRWLTSTLCEGVGHVGNVFMVLSDWRDPVPLRRAWCLWEVLAAIQQGVDLSVVMPREQRAAFDEQVFMDMPAVIKSMFDRIDAERAKASVPNDQAQILACVRDSIGFDGASLVVRDRLMEWLSRISESQVRDPQRTRDHLATATFCLRLAKIMSGLQGRHAEAESLLRTALDTRTVELGPTHELTLECSIALANVFRLEGKLSEAEVTLRKVSEVYAQTKGDDHEDTLLALATLTRVLVDRGTFDEAGSICKDVLQLNEAKYGVAHKRTLEALVTLSQLADLNTDSEAAAEYLSRALPGFVKLFGEHAPQTLNVKADLAGFLAEMEKFDEAERLFYEASEKLAEALGPQHPWTVKAATGLAVLSNITGKPLPDAGVSRPESQSNPASAAATAAAAAAAAAPAEPATPPLPMAMRGEDAASNASPARKSGDEDFSYSNPIPPSAQASGRMSIRIPVGKAGDVVEVDAARPPSPSASKAERAKYAESQFSSMRASRLEGIGPKKPGNGGVAARKHLRGWLEKLPVELSQRERERRAMLAEKHPHGSFAGSFSGGSFVGSVSGGGGSSGAGGGGSGGSFVGAPAALKRKDSSSGKSGMGRTLLGGLGKLASQVGGSFVGRRSSFKLGSSSADVDDDDGGMGMDDARLAKIQQNWRRRFFQVQSNQKSSSVVYWMTEDDCRNGREKRGDFILDDVHSRIFERSPFGPTCFAISGPRGRLHLRAPTLQDKAQWIEVFRAALAFRGGAEKAKLLEMGAGEEVALSAVGRPSNAPRAVGDLSAPRTAKDWFNESNVMVVHLSDLEKEHSRVLVPVAGEQQAAAAAAPAAE